MYKTKTTHAGVLLTKLQILKVELHSANIKNNNNSYFSIILYSKHIDVQHIRNYKY